MRRGRHFAMAAVAVAAIGVGTPGVAAGKTVRVHPGQDSFYTEAPFGQAFLLQGETLRIYTRPPTSGSTGYHWRIARRPSSRLLRRLSFHTTSDGKYEVLSYRARNVVGQTRLQLRYESPTGREVRNRRVYLRVAVNQRPPRYGCYPAHSVTQTENSQVRIFRIQRTFVWQAGVTRYIEYYGCEFRRNHAFALHYRTQPRPEFASNDDFTYFALNGTKVGFHFFKQCSFVLSCTDAQRFVESQDLHTGRLIRSVEALIFNGGQLGRDLTGLVLSPTGGLGWIEKDPQNDELNYVYKSDAPPARPGGIAKDRTLLDDGTHGYVDWDSLEYANGQVSWKREGVRQYAPLR
jgi:hypothetical protein